MQKFLMVTKWKTVVKLAGLQNGNIRSVTMTHSARDLPRFTTVPIMIVMLFLDESFL